jgi:16S rRNA (adenine1518-N6/adenine1519-N6)-dimethyltransferase
MKDDYPLTSSEEETLDAISRAAFGKRRKTLQNSLQDICPDKEALVEILRECGVNPKERPEDLPVAALVTLASRMA